MMPLFYFLQIVALTTLFVGLPAQQPSEPAPKTVDSKIQDLAKEYDLKFRAFHLANLNAKTPEQRQKLRELHPDDKEYAKRFLALAQEDLRAPATLEALNRVLLYSRDSAADAALAQLKRDWTTSPRIAESIRPIFTSMSPIAEGLLRDIIEKNTDRNAVGPAILGLAIKLDGYITLAMQRNEDPAKAKRIEEYYNKEQLAHIFKRDPITLLEETEALYQRAANDFADVKLSPRARQTIGEYTATRLRQLRSLAPGKQAPEIDGDDLDGKQFKLSDYRGKVVLLVFWASWCPPCLQQVPHELALIKRFQGKPFALLGVTLDHNESIMRSTISDRGITWRNWRAGRDDKIMTRYGIQAIPLVLVIDPDGIIRLKNAGYEMRFDQTIDDLVQAASKRQVP